MFDDVLGHARHLSASQSVDKPDPLPDILICKLNVEGVCHFFDFFHGLDKFLLIGTVVTALAIAALMSCTYLIDPAVQHKLVPLIFDDIPADAAGNMTFIEKLF